MYYLYYMCMLYILCIIYYEILLLVYFGRIYSLYVASNIYYYNPESFFTAYSMIFEDQILPLREYISQIS